LQPSCDLIENTLALARLHGHHQGKSPESSARPMVIPSVLIFILLCAVPIVIFVDGLITSALVGLIAAATTALVALSIPPGAASHLSRLLRAAGILAAIPAAFILVQLLPFTAGSLSKSIWDSASEVLGWSLSASATIDPGATVISLARYLVFVCIGITTAAIAIERRRAEWALISLAAVSTVTALILMIHDLFGFTFLGESINVSPRADIAAAAALSLPLTAASAVLVFERYETHKTREQASLRQIFIILGVAVAALLISAVALRAEMPHTLFAGLCGLAATAVIIAIRRLGLDRWAALLLAALVIGSAAVIAITKTTPQDADVALRFADRASPQIVTMAGRMVTDAGSFGTGAGTFSHLAQIYRDGDSSDTSLLSAPTTAAQVSTELGRLGLWAIFIVMLLLIAIFIRGAFNRGRDSFYAMAGAGCGVTAVVEAFVDGGLTGTALSVLLASVFGLGLAQIVSRNLSPSRPGR
jgi:hypothetical protein